MKNGFNLQYTKQRIVYENIYLNKVFIKQRKRFSLFNDLLCSGKYL